MPINLNDARYDIALQQALDDLPNSIPTWPAHRVPLSRYYEQDLLDVETHFNAQIANHFNYMLGNMGGFVRLNNRNLPPGYNPFASAFTADRQYELAVALGAALHYYVLQYHVAVNGDAVPNPNAAAILAFRTGNSRARHIVQQIVNHFRDNIVQLCQRLRQDWNDINALFFRDDTLLRLDRIQTTGSDFHKGGKQVLILHFIAETRRAPTRISMARQRMNLRRDRRARETTVQLIYKPSDMELDCRFVGDIAALRNCIPQIFLPTAPDATRLPAAIGAQGSLFEQINGHIVTQGIADQDGRPFRLPTYKILPRRPGSSPNNPAAPPPVADSYGYIEFLTHNPPWDNGGNPTVAGLQAFRSRHRDWLTKDVVDLRYYYRLYGWYIGIALVFAMADAHEENVLCHQRKPHLIDLEISMKWRTNVLQRTGLHNALPRGSYEKKVRLLYRDNNGNNHRSLGNNALNHINHGMRECLLMLGIGPVNASLLTNWVNDPLAGPPGLSNAIARYTPRATADYGKRLRGAYQFEHGLLPMPPAAINFATDTVANLNGVGGAIGDVRFLTTAGNLNGGALAVVVGDIVEHDGAIWRKRLIIDPPIDTVANINGAGLPLKGQRYVIVGPGGNLNPGGFAAGAGHVVEFDGAAWRRRRNLLPDGETIRNVRPHAETVVELNAGPVANGASFIIKGPAGNLIGGPLAVQSGDIVERVGGAWEKRASYSVPFVDYYLEDCRTWYAANGAGGHGRPNFASAMPPHDVHCYRNGDYPAYYHRLGNMDLLDARSAVVNIAVPLATQPAALAMGTLTVAGADVNGGVAYESSSKLNVASTAIQIVHQTGPVGIAHANRDQIVDVAGTTVTVTFGTDGAGATILPTAANLAGSINDNNSAKLLVKAEHTGTGASAVGLQVLTPLAYPHPWPALAGAHYFDFDIDGLPALNGVGLVTAQLQALTVMVQRDNLINNNVVHNNVLVAHVGGQPPMAF